MEVTGTVTDVMKEQRRSGEGWNYLLYMGEAKYYLKEEKFDDALFFKGNVATVGYTETKRGDKTYRNVEFIEPASEGAIATALAENGSINSSIESQVAAKIICELWVNDKLADVDYLITALRWWVEEKIGLERATQPVSPVVETVLKSEIPEVNMSPVNSFGELYTRAKDTFNMSRPDVWKVLDVTSQMEISDFNTAWQTIVSKKS